MDAVFGSSRPATPIGNPLETICAWCQRTRLPGGLWHFPEDHILELTHGICPDCFYRVMLDYVEE